MSQDIVVDALNEIMNAKRVEKKELTIKHSSKLLINLLEIMKKKNYIDYKLDKDSKSIDIQIIKLNECKAIKPRHYVNSGNIEKYIRRFLPSRKFGNIVISTNKGLMNHPEAIKSKIGGAIIAYFY
jgi:ribosomal protein S8